MGEIRNPFAEERQNTNSKTTGVLSSSPPPSTDENTSTSSTSLHRLTQRQDVQVFPLMDATITTTTTTSSTPAAATLHDVIVTARPSRKNALRGLSEALMRRSLTTVRTRIERRKKECCTYIAFLTFSHTVVRFILD